jgi:hypothetical protein
MGNDKVTTILRALQVPLGNVIFLNPKPHLCFPFGTLAVEMWTKEVYREHEFFPLGPLEGIKGPRSPYVLLLPLERTAFTYIIKVAVTRWQKEQTDNKARSAIVMETC